MKDFLIDVMIIYRKKSVLRVRATNKDDVIINFGTVFRFGLS